MDVSREERILCPSCQMKELVFLFLILQCGVEVPEAELRKEFIRINKIYYL